uniref:Uncharacterized protein n=1 Tax=Hepatitis E virus TaxID=1678143 RepID=A0A1X9HZ77_HEV|nr:hypothetical protein [Hepatitis E virus]
MCVDLDPSCGCHLLCLFCFCSWTPPSHLPLPVAVGVGVGDAPVVLGRMSPLPRPLFPGYGL